VGKKIKIDLMKVSERKFDLEERTAKFAENVIDFL
jgi:hypothetical protein